MSLLDNAEIPIPCSHCGRTTHKRIGWVRTQRLMDCACGTEIFLDSDHTRREIATVERQLADFTRELESLE